MCHSEPETSEMLDGFQTAAADPPAVRFHKAHRIWRSEADYFDSPWDYYVRFIDILKQRGAKFITGHDRMGQQVDGLDPEAREHLVPALELCARPHTTRLWIEALRPVELLLGGDGCEEDRRLFTRQANGLFRVQQDWAGDNVTSVQGCPR